MQELDKALHVQYVDRYEELGADKYSITTISLVCIAWTASVYRAVTLVMSGCQGHLTLSLELDEWRAQQSQCLQLALLLD